MLIEAHLDSIVHRRGPYIELNISFFVPFPPESGRAGTHYLAAPVQPLEVEFIDFSRFSQNISHQRSQKAVIGSLRESEAVHVPVEEFHLDRHITT